MPSTSPSTAARNGASTPHARHASFAGFPTSATVPADEQAAQAAIRCRLCTCLLGAEVDDDEDLALCGSCRRRPEARRLGLPPASLTPAPSRPVAAIPRPARDFTEAERALIRKIHGVMPAQQLLDLLNERLACDLGPDATPYSMEQLHAAIGGLATPAPAGGHGWASQRTLIALARRGGLLDAVTEQLIDDFAVVFSLNPKQVLVLRDTLLQPEEDA